MLNGPLKRPTRRSTSSSLLFCTSVCPLPVTDSNSLLNWFRSLADASLARLSTKLIVSLVYSHDIVSRLSLGSVQDLRNAAMWLCEAEVNGGKADEGWSAVIQRARRWKLSEGSKEDMNWVCVISFQPLDLFIITICEKVYCNAENT
jgi:hypothetical protein